MLTEQGIKAMRSWIQHDKAILEQRVTAELTSPEPNYSQIAWLCEHIASQLDRDKVLAMVLNMSDEEAVRLINK